MRVSISRFSLFLSRLVAGSFQATLGTGRTFASPSSSSSSSSSLVFFLFLFFLVFLFLVVLLEVFLGVFAVFFFFLAFFVLFVFLFLILFFVDVLVLVFVVFFELFLRATRSRTGSPSSWSNNTARRALGAGASVGVVEPSARSDGRVSSERARSPTKRLPVAIDCAI